MVVVNILGLFWGPKESKTNQEIRKAGLFRYVRYYCPPVGLFFFPFHRYKNARLFPPVGFTIILATGKFLVARHSRVQKVPHEILRTPRPVGGFLPHRALIAPSFLKKK